MIKLLFPCLTLRRRRLFLRILIASATLLIVLHWIGNHKKNNFSLRLNSGEVEHEKNYRSDGKEKDVYKRKVISLEDVLKPIAANLPTKKYDEDNQVPNIQKSFPDSHQLQIPKQEIIPDSNLSSPVANLIKEKLRKFRNISPKEKSQNQIHYPPVKKLKKEVKINYDNVKTYAADIYENFDPMKLSRNEVGLRKNINLPPDPMLNADSKVQLNHHKQPKRKKVLINEPDGILKVRPGYGEQGEGVYLEDTEKALGEKSVKEHSFNVFVSNMISLKRTIPDTRDEECLEMAYDQTLPSASVVIIYTNEQWSTLLRTIWSVYLRSPSKHLHEIILVDDFSDKYYLKEKLDEYIETHFKPLFSIRLIRLPKRSGLIRARLSGAEAATGDVLIFLDSHCECNEKWLEPLLHRIKEDRTIVSIPIIDVVDDKTLEYTFGMNGYFQIGGFDWNGHFNWINIPIREKIRKSKHIDPTRTPTMAGGLFAIEKNYFWEIGSYDNGMDVWGGENLEMSFRIWMCGGTLEIIPCSRVGHIFRSFHPYKFPGNKDTHGINTARTVEVWMDDYKRFFYLNRPDLKGKDIGDISDRQLLRKQKKCQSFKWYLENIYPEKFVMDENVVAYGRLYNPNEEMNLCVDTMGSDPDHGFLPYVQECFKSNHKNQFFSLTKKGEVRTEYSCLEIVYSEEAQESVRMVPCQEKPSLMHQWRHTRQGGPVINAATGKCLEKGPRYHPGHHGYRLKYEDCNGGHNQVWWFQKYNTEYG